MRGGFGAESKNPPSSFRSFRPIFYGLPHRAGSVGRTRVTEDQQCRSVRRPMVRRGRCRVSQNDGMPNHRFVVQAMEVVMTLRRAAGRGFATVWRAGVLALALLWALTLAGSARADVVTDWVAVAEAVAPRFGGPQQQTRAQAMVQIAVHDALNVVRPRYARYTGLGLADPHASPDAAVAAAARETMLGLLALVPDSPAKQAAIATIEAAYDRDRRAGAVRRRHAGGHRRRRGCGRGDSGPARGRRLGDAASALHAPPGARRLPAHAEPGVPGRDHALVRRLGGRHTVRPATQRSVRGRARRHLRPDQRGIRSRVQRGQAERRRARSRRPARLRGERHRALLARRWLELEPDRACDRERPGSGPLAARPPVRAPRTWPRPMP